MDDLCFGDTRYPAALTLAALMAYGGPESYVSAWLRHAKQPDDRTFRLYVSVFPSREDRHDRGLRPYRSGCKTPVREHRP